jgi:translation initiation factor 1A
VGKKKVITEEELKELVLPGPGQVLGVVVQMLGYDRLLVKCTDGHERVCRIRGKMKRRVWIKTGDVVLVAPWDFQYEARGDVLWRYTESQVHRLKSDGYLTLP